MCSHTFDAIRIIDEIPYFGKVWISGSGATDLLNWLKLRADRYAQEFAYHDLEEKRFHIGNSVALFLMEEDSNPRRRTLKTGVGGYYEAYRISHGKLNPLDDCITVFGDIIGRNRDRTVILKQLLYHCYRNDHLYVFSLLQEAIVSSGVTTKIPFSSCRVFDVPLLHPGKTPSPWTIHRIASEMLSAKNVRTVIRKEVNGHKLNKRFARNMAGPQLIKLSISGEHLAVELDSIGFDYLVSRFPSTISDAILV